MKNKQAPSVCVPTRIEIGYPNSRHQFRLATNHGPVVAFASSRGQASRRARLCGFVVFSISLLS